MPVWRGDAQQIAQQNLASIPMPPSRWLVYLLRCSDGSLYTGITNDFDKRLKAHAAGRAARYTRSRPP